MYWIPRASLISPMMASLCRGLSHDDPRHRWHQPPTTGNAVAAITGAWRPEPAGGCGGHQRLPVLRLALRSPWWPLPIAASRLWEAYPKRQRREVEMPSILLEDANWCD
jgi:hypothetical protein